MVNFLPHAYFIELVWFVSAALAFALAAWMSISTRGDREEFHDYTHSHRDIAIPLAFYIQADGNFRAEVWRVAETVGILVVSIWFTFFHSMDNKPVIFWALWENANPMRLWAVYITWCKVGAGLTARWYRHRASLADGRMPVRVKSAYVGGPLLSRYGRRDMFGREPAVIIGAIMSGLALAVAFGVQVSETQTEAIAKFLAALLPLVGGIATRSQVVPVSRIEDKGLSAKTLNPIKQ